MVNMISQIKPNWHYDAANLPFCDSDCPLYIEMDSDGDGVATPAVMGCAMYSRHEMPWNAPAMCDGGDGCKMCIPALWYGVAKEPSEGA